jgi:hypothetical protein
MNGVVSGRICALGLIAAAAVAGPACAETVSVTPTTYSHDLGNILITSGSVQARMDAATGAVTFSNGSAVRIKKNGTPATAVPPQDITIVCDNGNGGNCKHSYRVFITQVAVTPLATSIPLVNVSVPSCSSVNCTINQTDAAPSSSSPFVTIVSNNNTFTVKVRVGASVNINQASSSNSTAGWSYFIQVIKQPGT